MRILPIFAVLTCVAMATPCYAQVDTVARGLAARAIKAAPVAQPNIANITAAPTASDYNAILSALRASGILTTVTTSPTTPTTTTGALDFSNPDNSAFVL